MRLGLPQSRSRLDAAIELEWDLSGASKDILGLSFAPVRSAYSAFQALLVELLAGIGTADNE